MTTIGRLLKGVASLLLLLVLTIGVPIALWRFGGSPIPTSVPDWDAIIGALSRPDDGTLFLGALRIVGWLAWATFAVAVILEIPAQLRGIPTIRIRALAPQQRAAAALVSAILIGLTSLSLAPAAGAADSAPLDTGPVSTITVPASPVTQDDADTGSSQTETEQASTPEAELYQVQSGDSLWSIAQTHLGDGARWTEIRDLNLDREQPDGYQLTMGSEWIEPGWQLLLPSDATSAAAQPDGGQDAQEQTYTVQGGDTLSEIAAQTLGEADRYREIYDASRDTEQPDGAHLTDPDLIRPGWQLTIPATGGTSPAVEDEADPVPAEPEIVDPPASTGVDEDPVVEEPSAVDESQPTTAPSEAATQAPATGGELTGDQGGTSPAVTDIDEEAGDVDSATDEADDAIPIRTIGGAGALLAVGVLGLLAARRRRTQRTRPPGHRLALPAPGSGESVVEAELRAIADPIGMDTVNRAMRHLGSWASTSGADLPDVRAARLSNDGSAFWLYLGSPAELPKPWEGSANGCVWTLSSDDVPAHLADAIDAPAPWPALVTMGHDDEDAHLLLDLEQIGHLDIRGDAGAANSTLAALAVELATSTWADDLQVTLVGAMPELGDTLDTGRIRYVSGLDQVMRELTSRAKQAAALDTTRLEDPQAWTPEILLVGTALSTEQRDRLDELVDQIPRVGIAAVTADAATGEWHLDLDPANPAEGVLSPTELRIRPQQLTTAEYTQILTLLSGADQHVAGPTWAASLGDVDEPTLNDVPASDPAGSDLVVASPRLEINRLDLTAPVSELEDDTDGTSPDVDELEDDGDLVQLHAPVVRVLGPVVLDGVETQKLSRPSEEARALELVTYLALHPTADTDTLTAALWPTSSDTNKDAIRNTRNTAVSRARRWLGTNTAGDYYLPRASTRESNAYQLLEITTDWELLQRLIGQDLTTTPLPRLRKALQLVRGIPFSQARTDGRRRVGPEHYTWSEAMAQDMITTIVDLACETARRSLLRNDHASAAAAAQTALTVDSNDERAWRYALRAAHHVGDHKSVDTLINDLHQHLVHVDADPEPATTALIDDILNARTAQAI